MAINLAILKRQAEAQKLLESVQFKIKNEKIMVLCNLWLGFIYKCPRLNVTKE